MAKKKKRRGDSVDLWQVLQTVIAAAMCGLFGFVLHMSTQLARIETSVKEIRDNYETATDKINEELDFRRTRISGNTERLIKLEAAVFGVDYSPTITPEEN